MRSRPPRSTAEWASFLGSLAVVVAIAALILTQVSGHDRPPAPEATIDGTRRVGDMFHVDVTVHNDGDATAANVQVTAELVIGEDTIGGDQTIDFLSGGEDRALTFVFARDPSGGDLTVAVTGYAIP